MAKRYYCSDCGDYSADRDYPLTADGYPDTPVCKFCGMKCTGLEDDPRMQELNKRANRLGVARIEYQAAINALTVLAKEVKKDWGIKQLP